MSNADIIILGIESSCDETAASVLKNGKILANIIAGQDVHIKYGGVVPELASRAHQQNIVPVTRVALDEAGVKKDELSAVAYTQGPGLMGSLLVGSSFAKALCLGLNIPLIDVNHLHGHILSHFIDEPGKPIPALPFLCLTVSGGHTQIIKVTSHYDLEILGQTTDDAAGEAFDKIAKLIGLPYPGGPYVDKLAKKGNPDRFRFPSASVPGLDFSFSGLKTSVMYFIKKELKKNPDFIEDNKNDICASAQKSIIHSLISKLTKASELTGIKEIGIAGGVSANSGLRNAIEAAAEKNNWKIYIPDLEYCTDNAAMIAIAGYYKFLNREFAQQTTVAKARLEF